MAIFLNRKVKECSIQKLIAHYIDQNKFLREQVKCQKPNHKILE